MAVNVDRYSSSQLKRAAASDGCTCGGYSHSGRCSHHLAVQMLEDRARPSYEEVFGVCADAFCDDDTVRGGRYCGRHAR